MKFAQKINKIKDDKKIWVLLKDDLMEEDLIAEEISQLGNGLNKRSKKGMENISCLKDSFIGYDFDGRHPEGYPVLYLPTSEYQLKQLFESMV